MLLDENMPAAQRLLLRDWRIHFRGVGVEVGRSGTKDDNLIPCFHRLPQPTFFSLDRNFYRRDWIHSHYGLVWLNVRGREAANFIRRFLRHSSFNAQAKRMGIVARVHPDGVQFWQLGQRFPQRIGWHDE